MPPSNSPHGRTGFPSTRLEELLTAHVEEPPAAPTSEVEGENSPQADGNAAPETSASKEPQGHAPGTLDPQPTHKPELHLVTSTTKPIDIKYPGPKRSPVEVEEKRFWKDIKKSLAPILPEDRLVADDMTQAICTQLYKACIAFAEEEAAKRAAAALENAKTVTPVRDAHSSEDSQTELTPVVTSHRQLPAPPAINAAPDLDRVSTSTRQMTDRLAFEIDNASALDPADSSRESRESDYLIFRPSTSE